MMDFLDGATDIAVVMGKKIAKKRRRGRETAAEIAPRGEVPKEEMKEDGHE